MNLKKVDWCVLSGNPNAIYLLNMNVEKIVWPVLVENKNANRVCQRLNPFKKKGIDWANLGKRPIDRYLLEENIHQVDWYELSKNPNAIDVLDDENEVFIRVSSLRVFHFLLQNPQIVELVTSNIHEKDLSDITMTLNDIHWSILTDYPITYRILKTNLDNIQKIDWNENGRKRHNCNKLYKNLVNIIWFGYMRAPTIMTI